MSARNLRLLIGWGLTILVAVMPFHAFLSVWFGSLTGHEAIIQAWKELLLALLGLIGLVLVCIDRSSRQRLKNPLAIAILALAGLALIVTAFDRPSLTAIAFGIKTDLEFLLAFLLAWLVADKALVGRLTTVMLTSTAIVIGFGLIEAYVLPADFLTHFGYGSATVAPYQTITAGITSLRFPSTLGGANQLGAYLILPLCLALTLTIRRRSWWWLIIPPGLIVLYNTFSRSAWIGALVALTLTLFLVSKRAWRPRLVAVFCLIGILGIVGVSIDLARGGSAQYLLLHSSLSAHDQTGSDVQHGASLANGTHEVIQAPLGHGLGTAGPATFHAGTANIIEDYYLQLGFEIGVIGMLLFIGIVALLVRALLITDNPIAMSTAVAMIGLSIVALVLPAWTDSSMALVVWSFSGTLLGQTSGGEYV